VVFTSLFRVLKVIAPLVLIALSPGGCGDPCRNCLEMECSGSAIDCSRNDKTECEAKKKEAMAECDKYKSLCFKSCGARSAPPVIL
jgi:hypothetical protein